MVTTGIIFGLLSALAFGILDSLISFASRAMSSLQSIVLAQAISVLLLVGDIVLVEKQDLFVPTTTLVPLLLIGLGLGIINSLANLSLYKGMEVRPVALVSPISAAFGLVTTILSLCFLHDSLNWEQGIAVGLILGGVICCSIDTRTWRLSSMLATGRRYRSPLLLALLLAVTTASLLGGVSMAIGLGWGPLLEYSGAEGIIVLACGVLAVLSPKKILFSPQQLQSWLNYLLQKQLGVLCGLGAMLCFGVEFFSLSIATKAVGPVQPLLWSRLFSVICLFIYARQQRTRGWGDIKLKYFAIVVLIGTFDIAGMWLYDVGTQRSVTSIVASLSSTYTILPAFVGVVLYRERLALLQWLGVVALVLGVVTLGLVGK